MDRSGLNQEPTNICWECDIIFNEASTHSTRISSHIVSLKWTELNHNGSKWNEWMGVNQMDQCEMKLTAMDQSRPKRKKWT